jgi:hypothetical protein
MKHLKTFENLKLSVDKLDKIKTLNNPGFYTNDIGVILLRNIVDLDAFYSVEDKIKNMFNDFEFEKDKSLYDVEIFKMKKGRIYISILEMKDEYFYVMVRDTHISSEYGKIIADQVDGLLDLLTGIHKIIYS